MQEDEGKIVVPVIQEEVHADARPVQTGSVRVTKTVETHDELIEQELRKGRADVKRVQVNRAVDGPQQPYRSGNTLIIPVTEEVLDGCEKHWVLKEEIRVTQLEETHTVQHKVPVTQEQAHVERLDAQGNVISIDSEQAVAPDPEEPLQEPARLANSPIVNRRAAAATVRADPTPTPVEKPTPVPARKVLSSPRGILSKRTRTPGRKPSGD